MDRSVSGTPWKRFRAEPDSPGPSHQSDFVIFEGDRAPDKEVCNDPDEREKEHAQDEPAQSKSKNAASHQLRPEIVRQRQSQERHRKCSGAGSGKPELAAHQALEESVAMQIVPGSW